MLGLFSITLIIQLLLWHDYFLERLLLYHRIMAVDVLLQDTADTTLLLSALPSLRL